MPKMTNKEVISNYYRGNIQPKIESHTGNLYITHSGRKLMNYNTCLSQRVGHTIIINVTKYSVTTSKIQTWIKAEFAYNPSVVYTTKEVPIGTQDLSYYVNLTREEMGA